MTGTPKTIPAALDATYWLRMPYMKERGNVTMFRCLRRCPECRSETYTNGHGMFRCRVCGWERRTKQ